ncbi:unnamed protein product, partial [Trichobilharzia regenti]
PGTPILRQCHNHNINVTYILSSNNTNDDENSNGRITNNNRNISPHFINKRSHVNCNATETDEPESKNNTYFKFHSQYSLPSGLSTSWQALVTS